MKRPNNTKNDRCENRHGDRKYQFRAKHGRTLSMQLIGSRGPHLRQTVLVRPRQKCKCSHRIDAPLRLIVLREDANDHLFSELVERVLPYVCCGARAVADPTAPQAALNSFSSFSRRPKSFRRKLGHGNEGTQRRVCGRANRYKMQRTGRTAGEVSCILAATRSARGLP